MTQEQLEEYIKTGILPTSCTMADVVRAMQDRIENEFGEHGKNPNKTIYKTYMMSIDLIADAFRLGNFGFFKPKETNKQEGGAHHDLVE